MDNNVDDNTFLNDNFFEQCPPELLFYHVFSYLALNDLLTLRLVSKKLQALIYSFVISSKKKALYLQISTQKRLNTLIKNSTRGAGLPCVLVANRAMLNRLADSLLGNKKKNKASECFIG